jgi:hypothetical protein
MKGTDSEVPLGIGDKGALNVVRLARNRESRERNADRVSDDRTRHFETAFRFLFGCLTGRQQRLNVNRGRNR